ncbi:MAG: hypothetical protein FJY81_01760 [Candidatus Aminicenantes bacterium]|nr:hypothetical protein [Candidatus Aminicenantes bacterium]
MKRLMAVSLVGLICLAISSCVITHFEALNWLETKKQIPPGFDISGKWYPGWENWQWLGEGNFVQNGPDFHGTLGSSNVVGVISGNDAYFVITFRASLYTAKLTKKDDFCLIGNAVRNANIDSETAQAQPNAQIFLQRDFGAWLNTKLGPPPKVNISGTLQVEPASEGWGEANIIQEGPSLSGRIGSYDLKGVVSGTDVYLVLSRYWGVNYTARLSKQDDGTFMGKATKDAIVDSEVAKTAPGYLMRLIPLGLDNWLDSKETNPPKIDISGRWDAGSLSSGGWGDANIIQVESKLSGNIGLYKIVGIVSGTNVFLRLLSDGEVRYTARLSKQNDGNLLGIAVEGKYIDAESAQIHAITLIKLK